MIPFDVEEATQTGFYVCGTKGSAKTTLAKWLATILKANGIILFAFDVSQAWNYESPISHVVTIDTPLAGKRFDNHIANTVFDISRLRIKERFEFTNTFCRSLMDMRRNTPNVRSQPWIFFIFEESHMYLPNGCMRAIEKYGDVLDVVTVGRNFNISFGLITQFSSLVDKAPVKATQQRYFGLTTEKNDLTYIRGFLDNDDLKSVKRLNRGEFIYQFKGETRKFQVERYAPVNANEKDGQTWAMRASPVTVGVPWMI